jgi:predicted nucleic acid-binding protein
MIVLLDSTVLIDATRARANSLFRELVDSGHVLATCAVNISELYAGLRPNELQRAESLIERLTAIR